VASLPAGGLHFVVAPRRTRAGQAACRVRADYAITLQGFADGTPGRWGDPMTTADREAVTDMLAVLHRVPAEAGTLPVRVPDLPGRSVLAASLRERSDRWRGGPYAQRAQAVVAEHAAGLCNAMACFDDLAAQVTAAAGTPVITHGEPHPGNLIRRGSDYQLIDWDTAGLAQPERDLWWILSGTGAQAARYAELTGREVNPAAVSLYRLRWDLDDISAFVAEFRGPHRQDKDTEVAWAGFSTAVTRLATQYA